ncbi:BAH domain-containing protein [Ditylenchus destructor]|uniref:BAH domain-containing protein n=1 Tax=Ditylenchus destructor TaxID=166010 RepID=A0AAD4ND02_9BILA|nr:BAH domain-containing protein [Ditylenchus destructor]
MTQNMYRVGDYVYFEVYPSSPYQIRRIEELNKTSQGAVEAKVVCFYRRRDLPLSLLKIADQAERQNQILSRPKRSLLSRGDLASTSNGNDIKAEVKENGVEAESCKSPDNGDKEENKSEVQNERSFGFAGLPLGADKLSPTQIHALRQRELFLSRQIETLPATQIRGKCAVVILNEVETCDMYLTKEDAFFYSLVYDPANHTLLADKGKIELGEKHQADVPDILAEAIPANCSKQHDGDDNKENGDLMVVEEDEEQQVEKPSASGGIPTTTRETVVYHPHHNLTDRDIDQFLIIARAVGTFSRALDSSSPMKLPSLHMTASAASRDVTLLHAMALLHQANYDIGQSVKYLVPPPSKLHYPLDADKTTSHNTVNLGGPILCRDQLEEWSASEATLFEDALEKYGKDFHDIRVDCLPWKSMRDIVEYYYMWKTTARYTEMQKSKVAEQENKLKQVYIPSYNKANPNLVGPPNNTEEMIKSTPPCESCKADESTQWYAWGPAHMQLRLCNACWIVWKKRGGLKTPHEYESYDLDGDMNQTGGRAGAIGAMNRTNLQGQPNRGVIPNMRAGSLQNMPKNMPQSHNQMQFSGKHRAPFLLDPPLHARIARRMAPKSMLNMRKSARSPFKPIDGKAVMSYYYSRQISEVLRVARSVTKHGNMTMAATENLIKLHKKNGLMNGSSAAVGGGVAPAATRR